MTTTTTAADSLPLESQLSQWEQAATAEADSLYYLLHLNRRLGDKIRAVRERLYEMERQAAKVRKQIYRRDLSAANDPRTCDHAKAWPT